MTVVAGVNVEEANAVTVDDLLERLTRPVTSAGPRAMRHLIGRTIAETLNVGLDCGLEAADAILDLPAITLWRRATRTLAHRHAGYLNADPARTALPAEVVLRGKGLNDDVALAYVLGIGEPA